MATSVYAGLPVALQNAAITAWGLYSRRQRFGPHFQRSLEELRRSEWWSRDQIEAHQGDALRRVVERAYLHSPFYRRTFDAHGVRPEDVRSLADIATLPLLPKAVAREHASELVDTSVPKRGLREVVTSGTTGSPLRVLLTPEAQQFVWAVVWRHRARFGLSLGDKFLTFGARLPIRDANAKPPLWRYNHAIGQAYLSVHHLTPATMPAVVEWLNGERFEFFAGYPSAMFVLASFMVDRGLRLAKPPRCVATGSETLSTEQRDVIARAFDAPVTELYGMGEGVGGYSRCEAGSFHEDFELGIVELLPADTGDGPSDATLRRVVVTGLKNAAMPFVRYETGDLARVSERSCTCGRASATIASVDGRAEDYLRTPDGRMVVGMNQVLKWAPSVREAQIVQERLDHVEVRFVPGRGGDVEREMNRVRDELSQRLGPAVRIELRVVDAIPRGAGGKMRAVVSKVGVNQATREATNGPGRIH
jgi:phenylacetate-CoA ligase